MNGKATKVKKPTANLEDLKLVEYIVHKFEYFDGYYGSLCKVNLELKYREFSTLKDDFKSFYDCTVLQQGRYSIKELRSLKRSLMMLRNSYFISGYGCNGVYFNFLNETIDKIDNWVDMIIDEIVVGIV